MQISVVIPCHVKDLPDLKESILDWTKQSVKPKEIVVFLKPVESNFQHGLYDLDLKGIEINVLLHNGETTRGFAKNRAIENCSSELICMADADDRIHPQKLEFVKKTFEKNENCDIVLHYFSYNDISHFDKMFDSNFTVFKHDKCLEGGWNGLNELDYYNMHYPIHNAHNSFKKKLFENHKYDESQEACGSDDSIFNKDACLKKLNLFVVPYNLVSFNR